MTWGTHREPAIVEYIQGPYHEKDIGDLVAAVGLNLDGGSSQAMMSPVLDSRTAPLYIAHLCRLFDVDILKNAVGKQCFALRSFSIPQTPIEGIECGQRIFTNSMFVKKHYPDLYTPPLETAKNRLRFDLNSAKRRIVEIEARIAAIDSDYFDWLEKAEKEGKT